VRGGIEGEVARRAGSEQRVRSESGKAGCESAVGNVPGGAS